MQLPKALPDESLFSRICRCLSIYELPLEQVLQPLAGDKRAVIHPYLTSNLHVIAQFTDESSEALLLNQTHRPLFSYYLPQYRTVIENINSNSNEIIRASQLATFRGKERLSVKYCPLCAKDDIYDFGVAYWHLTHQVPGVEACSKHNTWLLHTKPPSRSHVNDHLLPDVMQETNYCGELARDFSVFVTNKVKELRAKKISMETLNINYLIALNANGMLTESGRVRRKELTKALFELSGKLFPVQSDLSPRSSKDYRFVSLLLSGQYSQHPFSHLLLEFYLSRCQPENKPVAQNLTIKTTTNKEDQCCELLKSGLSMAAVSREIDRSRCYVKSIALKNNIPVNLKPKTITKSLTASVVKLAVKGFHREVIAKIHNISSGSVEQIISITDGLVEWRKHCKKESLGRRYRCQIMRFITSNSHACRQDIKNACEAAFYWLYNHERDWLESVLPEANRTQHVERVDWQQRDNELVVVVTNLLLSSKNERKIPSRTELDRLLGGHGWLTSKIDKLPKTKELMIENGLLIYRD